MWEAEHNNLDAFVTLDEKFVRAVTIPNLIETPVKILTPRKFVEWISEGAPPLG